MLLGVDVGGTFTDAVLAADGATADGQVAVDPDDQSEGVLSAIEKVRERAGRPPAEIEAFSHGMTVATNALLEGRGARTALIVTDGFTDIVELGRQNRAELYRLCARRPEPLVAPDLRYGAPERMTPEGPRASWTAALRTRSPARWPAPSPKRSPSCCCTPTAIPSTSWRSARRWRPSCLMSTSRSRIRWWAPSGSSSGPPPRRSMRRSRRCWRDICAILLDRCEQEGSRAVDHAVQRGPD